MSKSKIEDVYIHLRNVGGGTVTGIHRATGMSRSRVGQNLDRLRAQGRAHIGGWRKSGTSNAALWQAGAGIDAPPPERAPRKRDQQKDTAYHRIWRARLRQLAAATPDAMVKQARQSPHTPFSALFI